jgi:hypothetical protein
MRKIFSRLFIVFIICTISYHAFANENDSAPSRQYIELRIYHASDTTQLGMIHRYLQNALLPALHRKGIEKAGVFASVENDTAADKKVYVLIPYKSLEAFTSLSGQLEKDNQYNSAGSEYLNTVYNKPAYRRYETILIHAFEEGPIVTSPELSGPKSERIYELRSYEGPTERLYQNKVQMFNKGGEVKLFKRLDFNAVFYGEVIAGSHMPNLMYMTSFNDRTAREAHWKTFSDDPEWKHLSSLPEYQHNVSKADIIFLHPTSYSDL